MLMYRRIRPCSSQIRRPSRGHRSATSCRTESSVPSEATDSVAAPSVSPRSGPGTRIVAGMSDRRGSDAEHVGQVAGDLPPGVALVGTGVHLAGPGAEVDARDRGVVGA